MIGVDWVPAWINSSGLDNKYVEDEMGEQVLVVPREILFSNEATAFQGFKEEKAGPILQLVAASSLFLPRDEVEEDPSYKQIIPYAVVSHTSPSAGEQWFLMKRKKGGGEKRLHNLFSLGVGGHINPVDDQIDPGIVERALLREVEEELSVPEPRVISTIGLLNDDSNPVGSVHFGIVFKISIQEGNVSVREVEQLEGSFVPCDALGEKAENMETWSRLICEGLRVLS